MPIQPSDLVEDLDGVRLAPGTLQRVALEHITQSRSRITLLGECPPRAHQKAEPMSAQNWIEAPAFQVSKLDRCDTPSVSTAAPLAATLEVLSGPVQAGGTVLCRIRNIGSVGLVCGRAYRLERKTAEEWSRMNPERPFRAIGFGVLPAGAHDFEARIPPHAPAGQYRISASAHSDEVAGILSLSAEFEVA